MLNIILKYALTRVFLIAVVFSKLTRTFGEVVVSDCRLNGLIPCGEVAGELNLHVVTKIWLRI